MTAVISLATVYDRFEERHTKQRYRDARRLASESSLEYDNTKPDFYPEWPVSTKERETLSDRFRERHPPQSFPEHTIDFVKGAINHSYKIDRAMENMVENIIERIGEQELLYILCLVNALRIEVDSHSHVFNIMDRALRSIHALVKEMPIDGTVDEFIRMYLSKSYITLYRSEMRITPQTYALSDRSALCWMINLMGRIRSRLNDRSIINGTLLDPPSIETSCDLWMHIVQHPKFQPNGPLLKAVVRDAFDTMKRTQATDKIAAVRSDSIRIIESWLKWD